MIEGIWPSNDKPEMATLGVEEDEQGLHEQMDDYQFQEGDHWQGFGEDRLPLNPRLVWDPGGRQHVFAVERMGSGSTADQAPP